MASAVLPSPSASSKKAGRPKKNNILTHMECYEEELSPAQLSAYSTREKEYRNFLSLFENEKKHAVLLEKNDSAMIWDLSSNMPRKAVMTGAGVLKTVQPVGRPANSYQLMMKPHVGLVVSPVNKPPQTPMPGPVPVHLTSQLAKTPPIQQRKLPIVVRATTPIANVTVNRQMANRPNTIRAPAPMSATTVRVNQPIKPATIKPTAPKPAPPKPVAPKPAPASSAGQVDKFSNKTPIAPDSREVQFSKLIGKTYPSLVVVARPQMKQKELTPQIIQQENTSLDAKVKSVLMYTPSKFTEWLIQQGLVRSEQFCNEHVNPDFTPVKLKLGMYSDATKFPFSGGYVWISDCCPERNVSVFKSSIFESSSHPPNILLKLMYHWSCQTVVQNILSWVKVDSLFVKNFFTNLRAVCTAAVHEKCQMLGGPKKVVEVGIISLGTTTTDGASRQVKVEVLGVLEQGSKSLRLIAVEPLPDSEKDYKTRFTKILQPLPLFVDKESIVVTDYTVDKLALHSMGFKSVVQNSSNETNPANLSNAYIMTYLRRVVPRMYQNTLSLLSRPIMQQFLDELVWRERWGYLPNKAFANIIVHLSEQTRLDSGHNILTALQNISAYPFKNWSYSMWKINCTTDGSIDEKPKLLQSVVQESAGKRPIRKRTAAEADLSTPAIKIPPQPSSNASEMVNLESYYCGTIPGDGDLIKQEKKGPLNMKCCACRLVFETNIELMTHLIGHAMSEEKYVSNQPQCRYCLKYFNSELLLQSHLDEAYAKTGTTLMCTICEEKFRDRTTLILHMHRNHYHLELPYECGICGFRSSQHTAAVDHFYQVHSNSEKVQCPYCLKIVAFANNGRKISQNLYFFLNHIQKHKRKTLARKCNKCALWFVHKGVLREHQQKDHLSFKDSPDIQPFKSDALDAIMMPRPVSDSPILVKSQLQKTKETLYDNNCSVNKFTNIEITGALDGSKCCECEGDFLADSHFDGYYSCMRCPYRTCCSKAMMEHTTTFHSHVSARERGNLGVQVILDKELHCVCGYKSSNGNQLAKHLVDCGRKSAYPSTTLQSQSASFPPLVNLDDHDHEGDANDKWLQAFVSRKDSSEPARNNDRIDDNRPRSMLDVLGLVRKPSTEETSSEKSASS
ncbi:uncharacterized protein LOC111049879 [Nilaparvata lugens]|uniref:uncharacterized protein LOC111049879 n=1 Tax=Nilaparvata lugens TaxID=108931 RepID=UPI00193E1F5F|nr:uncharacterized protein LOC111049879 [Nilaparvata lugens]XP_039279026.1 uncharacterized protein LOC111049879 [Nilaparvata lugens]XP_039279027.1 uncharacterized protein LOC111049879 [Nilaparvata lugens]XP_039279028.1 uncharacterized protein LOC111049879 [Nilaparvata lugens]XP_039279029.1 uncharacterized protein LOC111049879 [Nilaparvata lugens]XP_039279030.1 uncharacterized protein LOC111049879 [Nilaparvata lugens]